MTEMVSIADTRKPVKKIRRFVSLDFARGIAILIMLILHIVHAVLNIDYLMDSAVINGQPIIALSVLIFIPFFGGLAGFFLIISAASNMISMYRDLNNGKSVRSLVIKQVVGGFLLLVFAMICEGFTGYWGALGNFFLHLNDPSLTQWSIALWRWNHFETIHAIAWCLIFNGLIQGLLSLKGNWKNRKSLIISYIIMAVAVVGLTAPVWYLFNKIIPGYPFGTYPSGQPLYLPSIGTETFWQIIRTPFVNIFASPVEPIFPYLAVSFIGSIIGIVLSKPKEQIKPNFPRKIFLVAITMFVSGLIGILFVMINIVNAGGSAGIDNAIELYLTIIYHRYWSPDNTLFTFSIPRFAWLAQFLAVNGLSLIFVSFLLRLIEFRGISNQFAKRSKIVRRFGIVAFTNYNNQWFFFLMWEITSLLFYNSHVSLNQKHYGHQLWAGTALVIALTLAFYSHILYAWEKICYVGTLEWFIRTFNNNIIPLRRERFDSLALQRSDLRVTTNNSSNALHRFYLRMRGKIVDGKVKWWQRGQINPKLLFYDVDWVNITNDQSNAEMEAEIETTKSAKYNDSNLAFILSLIGMLSILFVVASFFSLLLAIYARKHEGKNKKNTAALIISIITLVILVAVIITLFILKIGLLGLF